MNARIPSSFNSVHLNSLRDNTNAGTQEESRSPSHPQSKTKKPHEQNHTITIIYRPEVKRLTSLIFPLSFFILLFFQ